MEPSTECTFWLTSHTWEHELVNGKGWALQTNRDTELVLLPVLKRKFTKSPLPRNTSPPVHKGNQLADVCHGHMHRVSCHLWPSVFIGKKDHVFCPLEGEGGGSVS